MPAQLNKVMAICVLVRDPEIKQTSGGKDVCNLDVAINKFFEKESGEKCSKACYIRVITWSGYAKHVSNVLKKGSTIYVEGELVYDCWIDQKGEKRSRIDILAHDIQFLNPKNKEAEK